MTAPARPRLTAREREAVQAAVAHQAKTRAAAAISAAATPVTPDPKTGRWTLRKREQWQEEAFDYLDTSPELGFATLYVENAFSKIRLVPAVILSEDEEPVPVDTKGTPLTEEEQATVRAELGRLRSVRGGQGRITARLGAQLFLVGECHLVGRPAVTPPKPDAAPAGTAPAAQVESWDVLSIDELVEKSGKLFEADAAPDGKDLPLPDGSLVIRVHQEHLRRRDKATSSVRATLDAIEELAILSRALRSTGKSRIAQNVIVGVPDELDVPPSNPDEEHVPLATRMMEHFITPISDEGSASASAPFIVTGRADAIAAMKDSVITIDRPYDKTMAEQRVELRTTIATGLDLPAEVLTGVKDMNHWNAWVVDEQKFNDHLEPRVITVCDALTVGWLRIALTLPKEKGGHGWTQERASLVVLWYDASRLITKGDPAKDADLAFDRAAISWAAYRRYKGYSDNDAPDDAELARRQDLGLMRAPRMGSSAAADKGGTEADPGPPSVQAGAVVASTRSAPGRDLSRRLLDIDRDLRARVETECDRAMQTALLRAGNRTAKAVQASGSKEAKAVVSKAARASLCATLGSAIVAQLGITDDDLLAGTFEDLRARWHRLTGQAQTAVAAEVARVVADPAGVERLTVAQVEHRDAGWVVLQQGLLGVAKARLYDATVDAEAPDEVSVPSTLIRRALTIAGGGAIGASASVQTAQVELRGGIGAGGDVYDLLDANGGRVEGYEWVYGISANGFPGHEALVGVQFATFDDEVLANTGDWPDEPYFSPGDHDGCSCDAMPLWALADDPERFYPHSGSEGISAPGEAA